MDNHLPRRPGLGLDTLVLLVVAIIVIALPWWVGVYTIFRWMTT